MDLVPAEANFCPLQFPKFQSDGWRAGGACDGIECACLARRRTCEERNQRVNSEGVESFVTSLWRFNVKVDQDDFEFLSHEMRSKFAIVVIHPPSARPPARPPCFCAIVLGNPMRHFRRRGFMRSGAQRARLPIADSLICHGYGLWNSGGDVSVRSKFCD